MRDVKDPRRTEDEGETRRGERIEHTGLNPGRKKLKEQHGQLILMGWPAFI